MAEGTVVAAWAAYDAAYDALKAAEHAYEAIKNTEADYDASIASYRVVKAAEVTTSEAYKVSRLVWDAHTKERD